MWPYYPELLTRAVPRYTSFPTAAEFRQGVGEDEQRDALAAVDAPVSLYVHIPFCSELCWYCGCNTGTVGKGVRLATYLSALEQEIDCVAQRLPKGATVKRIAFGGGSPNAISPIAFVRLLDKMTTTFQSGKPQISVEIDPRHFSEEWGETMGRAGVSHVSLGVQTFSGRIQRSIGRVQPFDQVARAVNSLRRVGVSSLNFDLMYGLPAQQSDDLNDSLQRTIALGADRIALFGYAHVPHLIPRQRRISSENLPDQAMRFAMAGQGYVQLTAVGYTPVGFDHFALPHDPLAVAAQNGTLQRNFQGFTDDQSAILIGLGASAISLFPSVIVQNEKNPGRYRMRLSQGRLVGEGGVRRSTSDCARGAAISDILCNRPTSIAHWLDSDLRVQLGPFIERNLIHLTGDVLKPSVATRPYARTIAALLDPYRAETPQRFSSAI